MPLIDIEGILLLRRSQKGIGWILSISEDCTEMLGPETLTKMLTGMMIVKVYISLPLVRRSQSLLKVCSFMATYIYMIRKQYRKVFEKNRNYIYCIWDNIIFIVSRTIFCDILLVLREMKA